MTVRPFDLARQLRCAYCILQASTRATGRSQSIEASSMLQRVLQAIPASSDYACRGFVYLVLVLGHHKEGLCTTVLKASHLVTSDICRLLPLAMPHMKDAAWSRPCILRLAHCINTLFMLSTTCAPPVPHLRQRCMTAVGELDDCPFRLQS